MLLAGVLLLTSEPKLLLPSPPAQLLRKERWSWEQGVTAPTLNGIDLTSGLPSSFKAEA